MERKGVNNIGRISVTVLIVAATLGLAMAGGLVGWQGIANIFKGDDTTKTEEGMEDKNFRNILESRLRTGDFNLFDNEFTNPNGKRAQSPTSHNKMNKDNVNTPMGRLAKDVAIKHTIKILNQLKEKINNQ